jgi:acyl-CoA reductase-like NAD-dependent aldehyde dehydrogenase
MIPQNMTHDGSRRRRPIGVVGAIVPWNAPAQLAALKIAPAICAGNTIVLKAAEDAPLAVLMIAEICQAHLPPGVVNVITGYGAECGAPLSAHPLVRKVSFTAARIRESRESLSDVHVSESASVEIQASKYTILVRFWI